MKHKKLYAFFSLFVVGVLMFFIGIGAHLILNNQNNETNQIQHQENAILNRDVVAIDLAGDYFIELSDPSKVGEFINEGNRTKGIYLILSKSREKQNEIFYEVVTNCNILGIDMNCKPVSMRNPVHHIENSESVYVMSIEFVRVR